MGGQVHHHIASSSPFWLHGAGAHARSRGRDREAAITRDMSDDTDVRACHDVARIQKALDEFVTSADFLSYPGDAGRSNPDKARMAENVKLVMKIRTDVSPTMSLGKKATERALYLIGADRAWPGVGGKILKQWSEEYAGRLRAMARHAGTAFGRKKWPSWFAKPMKEIGIEQTDPTFSQPEEGAEKKYIYEFDETTTQGPVRIPVCQSKGNGQPEPAKKVEGPDDNGMMKASWGDDEETWDFPQVFHRPADRRPQQGGAWTDCSDGEHMVRISVCKDRGETRLARVLRKKNDGTSMEQLTQIDTKYFESEEKCVQVMRERVLMHLIDGRITEKDDANKLKVALINELKRQSDTKGSTAMKRPAAASTLAASSADDGRSLGTGRMREEDNEGRDEGRQVSEDGGGRRTRRRRTRRTDDEMRMTRMRTRRKRRMRKVERRRRMRMTTLTMMAPSPIMATLMMRATRPMRKCGRAEKQNC